MRSMRRIVLLTALLTLLAAGSSSGASRAPAFKATLVAGTHTPTVNKDWKYSVRVTDPTGHPMWATITTQVVDPLGTKHLIEFYGPGHNPYVKNYRFFGSFCDRVLWPPSSALGVVLRFQTVIATAKGKVVLSYSVTPHS